jgi:hypothetical protein
MLQWLRAQDPPCPWDGRVVRDATTRGHHELAQWAVAHGAPHL